MNNNLLKIILNGLEKNVEISSLLLFFLCILSDSMSHSDASEHTHSGVPNVFNPESNLFKLCILVGACFLTFGSYYCYDIVGALSSVLLNPFYDINNTQESFLYAVYSLPNTVLPFFGGLLVDKYLGVKYVLFFLLIVIEKIILFNFNYLVFL